MPTATNSPLPTDAPAAADESSTANSHVAAGVAESDVGRAHIGEKQGIRCCYCAAMQKESGFFPEVSFGEEAEN